MALLFGLGWLLFRPEGLLQSVIESRLNELNANTKLLNDLNIRVTKNSAEIVEMVARIDGFANQFKNRLTSLESTRGHNAKHMEKMLMAQQLQAAARQMSPQTQTHGGVSNE